MNRFRFRLESVLRYRGAREEEKKREFGVAMGRLQHEEQVQKAIEHTIDDHDRAATEAGKGAVTARTLEQHTHYARALDRRKRDHALAVRRAADVVEVRRTALVEATRQRKILERLKAKKMETHLMDVNREEQALIDETANQQYGRSLAEDD